ncbi:hypothetical protein Vretimale_5108 [Volvox reticuliferus]|uniref:Uncharacterized protein n=2 Tax=Volvox reticuliferus TaxID=1737510 RepID=A0A8J4DDS2_9CHLO|nr:hypothetical protein Vretimale_5108 [Volvox reticuliferus]
MYIGPASAHRRLASSHKYMHVYRRMNSPAMMMKTWAAAACCLLLVVSSADGAVNAGDSGSPPYKAPGKLKYPPPPPPDPPTATFIGELKFVDTHAGDPRLFVLLDDVGNVMPFPYGVQLPDVDDMGTPISPGDIIELVSWTAGRLACMHA